MSAAEPPLLTVSGLRIGIRRRGRPPLVVVDAADLTLRPGEMLGVVGESGSGKTMLCRSLIGTLGRRDAYVIDGSVRLDGRELAGAPESVWRRIRGREIGYVPQSALAGPNPVLTVETQLRESLDVSGGGRAAARAEARRLLGLVRMANPDVVLGQYPHELSGGMRQRVMIASALARRPRLLVADEPTTGLDVTVQSAIMELLREVRATLGMAVILVSHDLGLIQDVCDRMVVMHAGATVESGATGDVLEAPLHPYTVALQRSRIDVAKPGSELRVIAGEAPAVGSWPAGCRFASRCELAAPDCRTGAHPPLTDDMGHDTACLHAERVGALR
jgi:oligopeptide/dipeptide ABC transporter ATP-binding protein